MNATTAFESLLAAPLETDWTIEKVAARLLDAVAANADSEWSLEAHALTDRQARRLLRPLLAYLATRTAETTGAPANLFTGQLSLEWRGPAGRVWIAGEFDNRAGEERIVLRRLCAPPDLKHVNGTQSNEPKATIGTQPRPS